MTKVGIIGAGPAGMFSAYKLSQNKKLDITLIDMGKRVEDRTNKDIMCGIGGAGTFSDGKLHFSPVLSHEKMFHLFSIKEYQKYLDDISSKRKTMVSSGDRSAKIRTYNYPQGRVTDHRINYSVYNLASVMDGNFEDFIEKLRIAENAERMKEGQ